MKKTSLLVMLFTLLSLPALAERPVYYPFDVKLGGQLATPTGGVVAKIAEAVASDAELEVVLPEIKGPIFVNFFVSDDKGTVSPENDRAAEVMMITSGAKALINQTISKSTLVSGTTYLANIVANNGTSRIVFKIK